MNTKSEKNQWRHEYKYMCDVMQRQILLTRAEGLLRRDAHTDSEGRYKIRSLYFDDTYNTCYYENENGTEPRAKYRIRIYNVDASHIVLEKKQKNHGMTHKESCVLDENICRVLMQGKYPEYFAVQDERCRRLLLEMQLRNLKPMQIVEYQRTPFVEQNGNVRITFDEQICASQEIGKFLNARVHGRPVMQSGGGLLEVKWDTHLPDYIKSSFELDSLKWSTFSKFYICRKFNIYGGIL